MHSFLYIHRTLIDFIYNVTTQKNYKCYKCLNWWLLSSCLSDLGKVGDGKIVYSEYKQPHTLQVDFTLLLFKITFKTSSGLWLKNDRRILHKQ